MDENDNVGEDGYNKDEDMKEDEDCGGYDFKKSKCMPLGFVEFIDCPCSKKSDH